MTENLKECKRKLKLVLADFNIELGDDYGVVILQDKATKEIIELNNEDLNVY